MVSKGPQMAEMPNIIGFTQDSAVKELEARGLVASCFMVVNDGSYASGCVVRTSEEPGTKVEVGTVITVYIAADPSVQSRSYPHGIQYRLKNKSRSGSLAKAPASACLG